MLNEREKIIYITAMAKKMIEYDILHGEDEQLSINTGRFFMKVIMRELGLHPKRELIDEMLKFEYELQVITGILNKECRLSE